MFKDLEVEVENKIQEKLDDEIVKEMQKKMLESISHIVEEQTHYNDRLTAEDIVKEYHIGKNIVYKMFKDKELPAQNFTRPAFVLRGEFEKYFRVRRDYLCN